MTDDTFVSALVMPCGSRPERAPEIDTELIMASSCTTNYPDFDELPLRIGCSFQVNMSRGDRRAGRRLIIVPGGRRIRASFGVYEVPRSGSHSVSSSPLRLSGRRPIERHLLIPMTKDGGGWVGKSFTSISETTASGSWDQSVTPGTHEAQAACLTEGFVGDDNQCKLHSAREG